MPLPKFTLGIEEEYQIIDPESRELASYIEEFLHARGGNVVRHGQMKAEFLQSQVEVASPICADIAEARDELAKLRSGVAQIAQQNGVRIAAAGTHPFSRWAEQHVTAGERYTQHEETMADVARQMLVFGMHLHVGIADRDLRIDIMNQTRYFVPHILALTTSSPFWHGRDTGLKSYRTIVMGNLPRAGLPPHFSSWTEYKRFVNTLISTHCIDEPTKIWWDIRPNSNYPTIEFRFADVCTRIDEAMCIVGILVGLVAKLIQLRRSNLCWRTYRRNHLTENKWRAARYGLDGKLIDFGRREEVSTKKLILEVLELIDDVVDEVGVRKEVEYAHKILEEGTSADRQRQVFRETGSLEAVVDHVVQETVAGC